MNYRHAYHAGNFADVLKHVILARVLVYLAQKPTPFRVIDAHAGTGRYDLGGVEAGKTAEWRDGIGRLMAVAHPAQVQELLRPYLDAVAAVNSGTDISYYPGSPRIAHYLMREGDQLIANELHSDDFALLKADLGHEADTKVMNIDALHAIKSLLPPRERRGVVLIDPPFEKADEFSRLIDMLGEGLKRFANGVFIIWYPVKDRTAANDLRAGAERVAKGKMLDCRLRVCAAEPGLGLTETGVLVVNPPFTLKGELEQLLPYLAGVLQEGRGAGHEVVVGTAVP